MSRLWQFAGAALGGNLLVHQLPGIPPVVVLGIIALAALIAMRRLPLLATALLAFCFTAWIAGQRLAARWPPEDDGRDVRLVGWIDDLPARDAGRTVFSLRVVEAKSARAPGRVRLSWYDPAPPLVAGQALEITARLRSPRGFVNPGGFDYERWLLVEGYDATGYVRSGVAGTGRRFGIAQRWLEFRAGLAADIARLVRRRDAAALIQALALGERGGFDDRHWAVLRKTGTSHLVAVSGLHIGMIAMLSYALVLRLALCMPFVIARQAHALAAGFSIVPASVYAALAGFTLPTRRALVMLLAVQLVVIARRRWPVAGALSLALILVLLLDPLASLTASFWLSFGAVAVILATTAPVESPLPTPRTPWLAAGAAFCRLQLALTLGLAPLVIWFFGQVSVISLAVNLIAIPVFTFVVVPASLLTALVAAVDADGLGIAPATGAIAEWAWRGLAMASAQPFAAFELPHPPLRVLLLALAAIGMGVTRHRLPGRRLALLALVPLACDHVAPPAPGFLSATVLDVGHGLAVAMQTHSHRVLFDAGPLFRSGFDAGAEIVSPALAALGGHSLDLMIISHGDSDHAGGAPAILERFPDTRVMTGPDVDLPATERCTAGESWTFDDVHFEILHPPDPSGLEGNDSSCVVRVETLAGALLLTGDIEARAEAVLTRAGPLRVDVVVVPHHGSRTSSTPSFVRSVSPRAAIVSAAHDSRWGFPVPEIRRRWQDGGAEVLVTGDAGAIGVVFGREGIEITAMRLTRHRYWQAKPGPSRPAP